MDWIVYGNKRLTNSDTSFVAAVLGKAAQISWAQVTEQVEAAPLLVLRMNYGRVPPT
jgi:hypothetical protein